MTTSSAPTASAVIKRNRANALKSTGPRTGGGKAVSRLNALKHGLCANPAAGVVEDRGGFETLHDQLADRFQPRDVVEAGLVHRIAVSLWRLQRAAKIDAAVGNVSANLQSPANVRVQEWIKRITNDFWLFKTVQVRNKDWIAQPYRYGLHKMGENWYRVERSYLKYADKQREEKIEKDGAGLMAMYHLIYDQMNRLEAHGYFGPIEAQFLAWLLGESAERLVPAEDNDDQRAAYYPDERPWASPIDMLIGINRKRPEGEPISDDLIGVVRTRMSALRTMAMTADNPWLPQQTQDLHTASLLPDAATLDRLLRYETHAEKSLHRSLELLAKMRGATVESIAATITAPGPAGSTVELKGERTQWRTGD